MKLIVGLGNPGKKYKKTWHNVGFMALDLILEKSAIKFSPLKFEKKFRTEISFGENPKEKIILAKPQTFMNKSGEAAQAIAKFYKIKPENIWIIHDDIDLPLGKLRITRNASAGGHKGVQSIIDYFKSNEMVRFRIGISTENHINIPTEDYVIKTLKAGDEKNLAQTLAYCQEAIEEALALGVEEAMNEFN